MISRSAVVPVPTESLKQPCAHTALLVEDDPETAAELGELLASFGHGHVHASSQAEAEPLIDKGGFCYVLLDLQIKVNPTSILARVEAGQETLGYIRQRYSGRNDRDKRHLQVLVMSGHAKTPHHVERSLQEGADAFILKPLSDNEIPFRDKIRLALRHSGRQGHARCAAVMAAARSAGVSATQAAQERGVELAITGREKGKKTEIVIAGQPMLLTSSSFILLLRLVAARAAEGNGWLHRDDLGSTDHGWKQISRLRKQFESVAIPGGLIENDEHGAYRLAPSIVPSGDWPTVRA
jgi:CheY-like chemotaxis protein